MYLVPVRLTDHLHAAPIVNVLHFWHLIDLLLVGCLTDFVSILLKIDSFFSCKTK